MAFIFNKAGLPINPATEDSLAELVALSGGGSSAGLPVLGSDTTGADGYATVVTVSSQIAHYVHIAVGNNGMIVSLDGGVTDHFAIPADTERLFPGLSIPANSVIQAKNLSAGNNYTNAYISVW